MTKKICIYSREDRIIYWYLFGNMSIYYVEPQQSKIDSNIQLFTEPISTVYLQKLIQLIKSLSTRI